MKPIGKSRGRGISLVSDLSEVVYAEQVVVQKYLKNPLLLRGHKFDMRIYVLVTSVKPLEAFLYSEGFARLSTEPFSLDPETLKNAFIHLTNYAIQKNNLEGAGTAATGGDAFLGGSKITLRMLRDALWQQKSIAWVDLWRQVEDICLKTLIACQHDMPNNPNSFEIFGYDIIIDDNLKCWLLEVNSSPSLARDFIIDDLVKQ
jgi:tubulin polyglutamylase TTLL5